MRISAVLHALFGLMVVLIAGVLLLPIYGDIEQRTNGQAAFDNARAARTVFAALQAVRVERGPTAMSNSESRGDLVGERRERLSCKLAEGEGFEPPRGLRPGGFQVHCLTS